MKRVKLSLIGIAFLLFSCTTIRYRMSSENVPVTLTNQSVFVLFDHENSAGADTSFDASLLQALRVYTTRVDYARIDPLSFQSKEQTIARNRNHAYLILVKPLDNSITKTKYAYSLQALNVLVEIRQSPDSIRSKCLISIRHPDFCKNPGRLYFRKNLEMLRQLVQ